LDEIDLGRKDGYWIQIAATKRDDPGPKIGHRSAAIVVVWTGGSGTAARGRSNLTGVLSHFSPATRTDPTLAHPQGAQSIARSYPIGMRGSFLDMVGH